VAILTATCAFLGVSLYMGWIKLAQDMVQWAGFCENGNEYSGNMKAGNFITSSDRQLCAMYSAL
jgi:hypothetical protein